MNETTRVRKIGATALVVLLLGGVVLAGVPTATAEHTNCHEDNDGTAPFSASGVLTNGNPVDIYKIVVLTDDIIRVDIVNVDANEDLEFVVSTQGPCVPILLGPSVEPDPDFVLVAGTYWLNLSRAEGTNVEYSIDMVNLSSPGPDCTFEFSEIASFTTPVRTLSTTNTDDRYRITVPDDEMGVIRIEPEEDRDIQFTLSRREMGECLLVLFGATAALPIDVVLSDGAWFLKLERSPADVVASNSVDYTLDAVIS